MFVLVFILSAQHLHLFVFWEGVLLWSCFNFIFVVLLYRTRDTRGNVHGIHSTVHLL